MMHAVHYSARDDADAGRTREVQDPGLRGRPRAAAFQDLWTGPYANVAIETLEIIAGKADRKALREARAWASRPENRALLRAAWNRFNARG